ncbi:MAG: hypothetical protein IJ461_08500, partial [Clostridia bacterium]|nr:hypothetical protein [Clostridia bacterium]
MKKALLWLTLLLIVCTATTAWAETMYAPYQMQVYAQPNYNAKLLGTVASGTACRVGLGSTNDGWNKYSFSLEGKSITGWVYGSATYNSNPPPKDAPVYDMDKLFFQIVSDGSSKSTSSSGGILSPVEMGHWVEASGASGTPIYASYSASSKVLTTVEKNTVLYVSRKLADESMYYATANGKTGYVLASQVDFTVSGTLSDTEPIIRYAGENGLRLYRMCGVFSQLHLGNYKTGVCVKVLGQHSRSWAYVQVGAAKGYALYSELTDAPPEAAASETLYVTCDTFDNVTLSTEPGDSGRHMGVLMVGTPVCVLAQQGNYYRVQVGDEIGYLPKSNLQRKSDSQDADKQVVGIRYVCSESGTGAYLFKEPSLTSHIIELVPERAKVSFLRSYSNGFAYVIYNGQAGYM